MGSSNVCAPHLYLPYYLILIWKKRLKQSQKAGKTASSQISLLLHSFRKAQTFGDLPVFMQCMWLLSVWTLRRVTSRSLKGRKRKRRRGRQGEEREEAEGGCGLQSCAVYSALCSALCQKSEFHLYINRLSFRKKCSDHCQRSMVPVHIAPYRFSQSVIQGKKDWTQVPAPIFLPRSWVPAPPPLHRTPAK